MIRLLFVGDGERDVETNPPLVKTIVATDIQASHSAWKELRLAGGGHGRKLKFAVRQARDKGLHGVVATVDEDKSPSRERLKPLIAARKEDREKAPPVPTALGCAAPHAEAWLLDDPMAVRDVLHLDNETVIANVRKTKSPKDEIGKLHAQSPRSNESIKTILGEIAASLVHDRCAHAKETGFAAFVAEIKDEIKPLAEAP
jgi:hypothetical protein